MKSIEYLLKAYGVAKESKKDELFFFISIMVNVQCANKTIIYFSYNSFTK